MKLKNLAKVAPSLAVTLNLSNSKLLDLNLI